jgi:hypothetical protein
MDESGDRGRGSRRPQRHKGRAIGTEDAHDDSGRPEVGFGHLHHGVGHGRQRVGARQPLRHTLDEDEPLNG